MSSAIEGVGKGTITVWENVGGTRGKQIYQLKGIPLTPVSGLSPTLRCCRLFL